MSVAYTTVLFEIESIVFASTPGRAKYATLLSAEDAGYRARITDVRCRRSPILDCYAAAFRPNIPYSRERIDGRRACEAASKEVRK